MFLSIILAEICCAMTSPNLMFGRKNFAFRIMPQPYMRTAGNEILRGSDLGFSYAIHNLVLVSVWKAMPLCTHILVGSSTHLDFGHLDFKSSSCWLFSWHSFDGSVPLKKMLVAVVQVKCSWIRRRRSNKYINNTYFELIGVPWRCCSMSLKCMSFWRVTFWCKSFCTPDFMADVNY